MKKKLRADFHIHSSYSFDGVLPPKQIVNYAINQNAKWIAITDHNNLEGVRDLWDSCAKDVSKNFGIKYYKKDLYNCPYIGYKGVNIVSGLEATCRISAVENKKGNSSKIHLLVYGADINKNLLFLSLWKLSTRMTFYMTLERLNTFYLKFRGITLLRNILKNTFKK